MEPTKDTVYIEVDEDITSIIDKVTIAKQKIVAVVLPKRSAAMQSIVNMRLLKKSAESAGKNVVLITSDPGLLPLASAAELYVAKNLQSKPEVPSARIIPQASPATDTKTSNDEDDEHAESETEDSEKPDEPVSSEDDAIPIGEDAADKKPDNPSQDNKESKIPSIPKIKALKVPNFEKFRLVIGAGVLGAALIIFGIFYAFSSMPNAKITITTDSVDVSATFNATSAVATKTFDDVKLSIPGEQKKLTQAYKEDATSTGKQDVGTKATGTLTIKNCTDTSPSPTSVAAGDRFTSASGANSGKVFVSSEIKNINPATVSGGSIVCGNTNITVIAESPGDTYNNSSSVSYTSTRISYAIIGSAMSGGASRVATVVAQADIDGVKQKDLTKFADAVTAYKKQLTDDGYYVFTDTAKTDEGTVISSAKVGDEAATTSVSFSPAYTIWAAKKADMNQLILSQLNKQIDTAKLTVAGDDLATGSTIKILANAADGISFSISKDATAAPAIDQAKLKSVLAGKKKGEVQSYITSLPGIQSVEVKMGPFWVDKVPKKANKVTITLKQNQTSNAKN